MLTARTRVSALLVAFVFMTLVAGRALYVYSENRAKAYQWNVLEARANQRQHEITWWTRERETEATMFWAHPMMWRGVERYLERGDTTSPEWQAVEGRAEVLLARGTYQCILLLDGSGHTRYHRGAPIDDLAPYREAADEAQRLRRTVFQDFTVPGAQQAKVHIALALPLIEETGRYSGTLVFRLEPYIYATPLEEEWPIFKSTAEVLVFDMKEDHLNFLTQPRFGPIETHHLSPSLLMAKVVSEEGRVEGLDYRSKQAIGVGRSIPNTPWHLVAKVDQAEIEGIIHEITVGVSLLILLLLAGGLVVANAVLRGQAAEARYREQEARQAAFRAAQKQLIQSEKLAALSTVAAGVAHELHNPLMGVMNYVAFARRRVRDPELVHPLDRADEELKRVRDLLKSMLTFAAPPGGTAAGVDVAGVLARIYELLAPEFHAHNIAFVRELAEPLPPVSARPGALQQVFVNLLLNARDAISASPEKRVILRAFVADEFLVVEVRDTGQGIPETIRGQIFDPFFTTKPPGQGTGLGLSIARTNVEELKGTIEVQSTKGLGTTFTVRLPLSPEAD